MIASRGPVRAAASRKRRGADALDRQRLIAALQNMTASANSANGSSRDEREPGAAKTEKAMMEAPR